MEMRYLDKIESPRDLKKLDHLQLEKLCGEIRNFLIENVSVTGGHLSSNLGVIELTVALHYAFESPTDMLVFDVGHQCYTHKLLTGRRAGFAKLRMQGGLSGFPAPRESEHDIFLAGHGSTALSAGVGLARAKKLKGEPGHVIVIVGDGAFTGGMVYEALNNLQGLDNLVVILNDNKMSISKSEGAMAHYFTRLRTSPGYYKAKNDVKSMLEGAPLIGEGVKKGIQSVKSALRRTIYNSTFFEEMGFQYIGPVDGHDLAQLCTLFAWVKHSRAPLFIHAETTKGKGFRPAEQNPGAFHGVSSFNHRHITDPDISPKDSYSTAFGQELSALGEEDKRICAITAAMKYGTGLQYFKKNHRERFFDVGIAEEHAVTFAAGLARAGMQPVVAIYSTFLQRGYDQLIHDVMLQNLDVLFAIDRAGLVPGDGETHQGLYDAAYLSQQQDMIVVSPSNYAELRHWLRRLLQEHEGPRAIRYPRGEECGETAKKECTGKEFDRLITRKTPKAVIVTYGSETEDALAASELLAKSRIWADVVKLVVINPLPEGLVEQLMAYPCIVFAEEGIQTGGIGEHVAAQLLKAGYKGGFCHAACPSTGVDHATVPQLKELFRLDGAGLAARVKELCNEG